MLSSSRDSGSAAVGKSVRGVWDGRLRKRGRAKSYAYEADYMDVDLEWMDKVKKRKKLVAIGVWWWFC